MPLQIIPFTAGQTPWLLLCADTADVSAARAASANCATFYWVRLLWA